MKPLENWDMINEAGEFKRLPAGPQLVKFTTIVDVPANEYLEVYCDVAKGEYTGYFKQLVDAGLKDSSRTIRSYKVNAIPFFKAFITAVEKTNPGYNWDWDEQKLVGKYAVAVFGEEEYLDKDGEVKIATRINEFRSVDAWKEGKIKIPELKKLPVEEKPLQDPAPSLNLDELPF